MERLCVPVIETLPLELTLACCCAALPASVTSPFADTRLDAPAPCALHVPGLQQKTCSTCSWLHFSQELEPPPNPGRFRQARPHELATLLLLKDSTDQIANRDELDTLIERQLVAPGNNLPAGPCVLGACRTKIPHLWSFTRVH